MAYDDSMLTAKIAALREAAGLPAKLAGEWTEELHPRDKGKFTSKGQGGDSTHDETGRFKPGGSKVEGSSPKELKTVADVRDRLTPGTVIECTKNTFRPDMEGEQMTVTSGPKGAAGSRFVCEYKGKEFQNDVPRNTKVTGSDSYSFPMSGHRDGEKVDGTIAYKFVKDAALNPFPNLPPANATPSTRKDDGIAHDQGAGRPPRTNTGKFA